MLFLSIDNNGTLLQCLLCGPRHFTVKKNTRMGYTLWHPLVRSVCLYVIQNRHTYMYTCMHARTCAHTQTLTRTLIHTHTLSLARSLTHSLTHSLTQTQTHTHTHTPTLSLSLTSHKCVCVGSCRRACLLARLATSGRWSTALACTASPSSDCTARWGTSTHPSFLFCGTLRTL